MSPLRRAQSQETAPSEQQRRPEAVVIIGKGDNVFQDLVISSHAGSAEQLPWPTFFHFQKVPTASGIHPRGQSFAPNLRSRASALEHTAARHTPLQRQTNERYESGVAMRLCGLRGAPGPRVPGHSRTARSIVPPSPSGHLPICVRTSRGIGAGNFGSSRRRTVEMKVRSTLLCLTHESFMQGSRPACMPAGCWRLFGSEFRLKLQCSDQALT